MNLQHGWRNLFQSGGGTSARQKNHRQFLWCELATVTSQALEYDAITYTPYEGHNYPVLDIITSLWKRIGVPPEIQIRCYRGDPGQQRHSGSLYNLDWLHKTVRLKYPFAFILAGIIFTLCHKLSNNKWVIIMMTSPLLSNIRHRAMITPVSPLLTRLIHISPSCWTIYRPFEIILEMVTVYWIGLQIQCTIQIHCFKRHSVRSELFNKILYCIGQLGLWWTSPSKARAKWRERLLRSISCCFIQITCNMNVKGTEPSPEGLPLGNFMFVQEGLTLSNFAKHLLIYSDSHFTLGRLEFCLGG